MGQTRAKYGGVLVKKIEQDGDLRLHVMAWRDMVTDQVDIRSGVKIFRDYYTPADLKKMTPKWKNVNDAIAAAKKSKEATPNDGTKNETPGAYVPVYFVDGVLPTCYLRGTSEKYGDDYGSEDEYERLTFVVVLDESDKEKTSGATLYAGRMDEDPYKYLEYEKVPGRGLGIGVVEDLFEAQVWTNYTAKQKKDMLDLAGKILFQTSDTSIAAKNVLTDLEVGEVITTAPNMPITQVNNVPIAYQAIKDLGEDWDKQGERVSSTFNAMTGEDTPATQPWSTTSLLNQQAGSTFEYRREEAGEFLREIFMDWVLPFLVKQIKKDKELTATLEPEELELVSDAIANHEALSFAKEQVLAGNLVTQQDVDAVKAAARESSMKLRRKGFKDFADIFDEYAALVDVITTGEQKNKVAVMQTIDSAFKFIASMQLPDGRNLVLEDGPMRKLFLQLMEATNVISPLLFSKPGMAAAPAQPAPLAA
jgi:hypothetical protein